MLAASSFLARPTRVSHNKGGEMARFPLWIVGVCLMALLALGNPSAAGTGLAGSLETADFVSPPDNPDAGSIIDAEGGSLTTPDGRVVVSVPAGALAGPTIVQVSTSLPTRQMGTVVQATLGLQELSSRRAPPLAAPIAITFAPQLEDLQQLGAVGLPLSLKQLNPSGTEWVAVNTTKSESGYQVTTTSPASFALFFDRPHSDEQFSGIVPAAGGIVSSQGGDVSLEFPSAAVAQPVRINYKSINQYAAPDFRIVREFELSAVTNDTAPTRLTRFSAPVKLTIRHSAEEMSGLNYGDLKLYWHDDAAGSWVPVENQINNGDGSITASLNHFSVYSSGSTPYISGPGNILWHQGDEHAGAATYDIPFDLPAGPGGFAPRPLTVSYNSSRVDEMKTAKSTGSWLGIGWDMSIPSIRRDPATGRYFLEMDGVIDELIKNGVKNADGSQPWSTRSEQYRRISSKPLLGQATTFIVVTKDGTTYRFGTTTGIDSPDTNYQRWYYTWTQGAWQKQVYRLDLGRVIDMHGNYADYTYLRDTPQYCPPGANPACQTIVRSAYPATLQWGARVGGDTTQKFKVVFTTTSRTDAPVCGSNDPLAYETLRLTSLELDVLSAGSFTLSKRFALGYSMTAASCPNAGRLKLTSLKQIGTDGDANSPLFAATFDYGGSEKTIDYKNSTNTCISLTWPYLQTINNGYGATTTLAYDYKWLAGASGTDPNCSGTQVGTWSREVLASRSENPGIGPVMSQTFAYTTGPQYYQDPGLNPIDAEYRGFRQVDTTDAASHYSFCRYYTTGVESETGLQGDVLTSHPFHCEWYQSFGGALLKKSFPVWTSRSVNTNINFVYQSIDDTYLGSQEKQIGYAYDSYGNLSSAQDQVPTANYRETVYQYAYNTTDWIVSLPSLVRTDRYSGGWITASKTTYAYDGNALYTTPPTKGDLTREDHYDDSGVAHTIKAYTYADGYGNRTRETKYRDATHSFNTDFVFDSTYHTYVTSQTDVSTNQTTNYSYDFVLGQRTIVTDPNGSQFKTNYDKYARVGSDVSPGDSDAYPTTVYTYNWDATAPNQTVTQRREQAGTSNVLSSWQWLDGLRRTLQSRSEGPDCNADATTDTAYDNVGQVASQSIPYMATNTGCVAGIYTAPAAVGTTQHLYDALGRETQVTQPNGGVATTTYTDYTTAIVDENGHKTENIKDAFGRLVAVKEYAGTSPNFVLYATTTFAFDVLDRQTSAIDPAGEPSTTTYNRLGFKTQTADPDMGTWNFTYFDDGLLKTKTDARGQIITYAYDSLDRITSKAYSGWSTPPTVTYSYDTCQIDCPDSLSTGRLTLVSDWSGQQKYKYDARGQVIKEQHVIGGTTYTVSRGYDSLGRETSVTYPDNEVVSTTFDGQGLPETLSGTSTYVTSTNFNAASMPTTINLGNSLNMTDAYRSTDLRLTGIATSGLFNQTYGYDPKGNINNIQDSVEGSSGVLAYDDRDRLASVAGTGFPQGTDMAYTYDTAGNIISKKEQGGVQSSWYTSMNYDHNVGVSPGPHAITSATPYGGGTNSTFTYDQNGNTLVGADQSVDRKQTYTYNAEAMVATRTPGNGPASIYTYDANGTLIQKDSMVYIAGIYEKDTSSGQVTKYYFINGQRVAMRKAGTLYYITGDQLGGTALVTNTSGGLVSRTRYFPYGLTRTQEGTAPTDKLFTGQQQETSNGIYNYKAREYNADIGRMPQADTIVPEPCNPPAYNRYSYVVNNPANRVDPTGNWYYWSTISQGRTCSVSLWLNTWFGFRLWSITLSQTWTYDGASIRWFTQPSVETHVNVPGWDLGVLYTRQYWRVVGWLARSQVQTWITGPGTLWDRYVWGFIDFYATGVCYSGFFY